jgi:hypothetical protein
VCERRIKKSSIDRRYTWAGLSNLFSSVTVACTRCKTRNLPDCLIAEHSVSCGNCLSAGNTACDAFGYDDSVVQRLVAQQRGVDQEEQDTLEAIKVANCALVTALARGDRLRTQRQALKRKALVMFQQEGEVLGEQRASRYPAAPLDLPFDPVVSISPLPSG